MCVIIIMNNITIIHYNYFMRYYSKDFVRYHKFIECFGFHMSWQLTFPSPLSTINCTTGT